MNGVSNSNRDKLDSDKFIRYVINEIVCQVITETKLDTEK